MDLEVAVTDYGEHLLEQPSRIPSAPGVRGTEASTVIIERR